MGYPSEVHANILHQRHPRAVFEEMRNQLDPGISVAPPPWLKALMTRGVAVLNCVKSLSEAFERAIGQVSFYIVAEILLGSPALPTGIPHRVPI